MHFPCLGQENELAVGREKQLDHNGHGDIDRYEGFLHGNEHEQLNTHHHLALKGFIYDIYPASPTYAPNLPKITHMVFNFDRGSGTFRETFEHGSDAALRAGPLWPPGARPDPESGTGASTHGHLARRAGPGPRGAAATGKVARP